MILGIIAFLTLFFVTAVRRWPSTQKPISWTLAITLLGSEIMQHLYLLYSGRWHYECALPLHLCDLAIFAVAISLIFHIQWIWELAYFWGLGGSLYAIITPDLPATGPRLFYIAFMVIHGCVVIGSLYLAFGLRRQLRRISLIRVWLITQLYVIVIGVFNSLFGTNYLYLCEKPGQATLMDFIGPWPYYLITLQVVFLLSLFFYYGLYLLLNRPDHN